MTKTAITYCIALLCSFQLFAQPKVELSEPYPVVDAFFKNYYYINDMVYSIKVPKSSPIIQKFDPSSMREISRIKLELPDKSFFEDVQVMGEKTFILYSTFDKKTKEHLLFSRSVNLGQLNWDAPEQLMLKASGEVKTLEPPEAFIEPVRRFTFHKSSDETKLLVKYRRKDEITNARKNFERLGLFVFDNNLAPIWGREENMPYEQSKLIVFDFAIANSGNVFMLAKVYHDHYLFWTGKPIYGEYPPSHLELITMDQDRKGLKTTKPDFTRPFVYQVHFINNYKGDCAITGFYSREESAPTESFFLIPLNSIDKIGRGDLYPISHKELITEEARFAKQENRSPITLTEYDLNGLYLNSIQQTQDGAFIYIFQNQLTYIDNYERYAFSGMQIVAVKTNSSGEVAWIRYMPKNQISQDYNAPEFYHYSTHSSSLCFLYIDHLSNEELMHARSLKEYTTPGHGNLTAYILNDVTGKLTKEIIVNTGDMDGTRLAKAKASKVVPLEDGSFLLEGYQGGKKDVMAKFELDL